MFFVFCLGLRLFCLPVQLGPSDKLIYSKIARNWCTHILGSPPPPIFCENCVGAPPHKFRTISTHVRMPPHIFHTNFWGLVGTALSTSFARFPRAHGLFSRFASVQAKHVSSLGCRFGAFPDPNFSVSCLQTRKPDIHIFIFLFLCVGGGDMFGVHAEGRTLQKGVFLPSKHLLSAFYDRPLSKNPSENLCPC